MFITLMVGLEVEELNGEDHVERVVGTSLELFAIEELDEVMRNSTYISGCNRNFIGLRKK